MYCARITKKASKAGLKLKMTQTPAGWSWEWSNGIRGHITAHTQPVALMAACQSLEQEVVL